ncbi:response regulator transcription factor [Blastopirellula marina]|uniref:DNA-binding response regulator n=1 Tax=Blastopirellula marina TaxID=124 RepID=A0A2S8GGY9_9BACT|nr:response regulator transcription factor [Blastopirellula marina]PQO39999.1 DNA-binding response regulator [Blastopirellula marina]PQO43703.1 DNA-binding response regulator [Blastopirellula marina]PTL45374.1 DNA-binding response regulator [Blastopirellula marina]
MNPVQAKSGTQLRGPKVVLVDDDEAIMRCVGRVLEMDEDIVVVGQTDHAQAGVAMVQDKRPDVVLMDIHMPGADPFLACREIQEKLNGACQVLFYTAFPRDQYLDRCIASGAAGIVSKHSESIRNVALAIRHVAAGNNYFSPELAKRLIELESGAPVSRIATMTHREISVLRELASGKTQLEIAEALDLSERTVNKEVGDLKEKLALRSLNELLIYAVNEGLAHPELIHQYGG